MAGYYRQIEKERLLLDNDNMYIPFKTYMFYPIKYFRLVNLSGTILCKLETIDGKHILHTDKTLKVVYI